MYSTSSCEWVVGEGGSEQRKGPQSLFVEGLLEGGGQNNNGATVFVCTTKKKQRKGIADRLFQGGGGSEQQLGHSLCL